MRFFRVSSLILAWSGIPTPILQKKKKSKFEQTNTNPKKTYTNRQERTPETATQSIL